MFFGHFSIFSENVIKSDALASYMAEIMTFLFREILLEGFAKWRI